MSRLFAEAVLAFVALPGVVAYFVPILFAPSRPRLDPPGLALVALGSALLLGCVWQFYSSGRGTLAPWTPPRHLVNGGLYRFSRNPMYVAVILVLWGWAWTFRSPGLATYAAAMMVVFHFRVVWFEEPWLAETHGESWTRYKASVPRWIGRLQRSRQPA
jgi:protein-S-isoprenylcysteine O-methyltransferase Ste14